MVSVPETIDVSPSTPPVTCFDVSGTMIRLIRIDVGASSKGRSFKRAAAPGPPGRWNVLKLAGPDEDASDLLKTLRLHTMWLHD